MVIYLPVIYRLAKKSSKDPQVTFTLDIGFPSAADAFFFFFFSLRGGELAGRGGAGREGAGRDGEGRGRIALGWAGKGRAEGPWPCRVEGEELMAPRSGTAL